MRSNFKLKKNSLYLLLTLFPGLILDIIADFIQDEKLRFTIQLLTKSQGEIDDIFLQLITKFGNSGRITYENENYNDFVLSDDMVADEKKMTLIIPYLSSIQIAIIFITLRDCDQTFIQVFRHYDERYESSNGHKPYPNGFYGFYTEDGEEKTVVNFISTLENLCQQGANKNLYKNPCIFFPHFPAVNELISQNPFLKFRHIDKISFIQKTQEITEIRNTLNNFLMNYFTVSAKKESDNKNIKEKFVALIETACQIRNNQLLFFKEKKDAYGTHSIHTHSAQAIIAYFKKPESTQMRKMLQEVFDSTVFSDPKDSNQFSQELITLMKNTISEKSEPRAEAKRHTF